MILRKNVSFVPDEEKLFFSWGISLKKKVAFELFRFAFSGTAGR